MYTVRVCACVRARVCVRVFVRMRAQVRLRVHVCMLACNVAFCMFCQTG